MAREKEGLLSYKLTFVVSTYAAHSNAHLSAFVGTLQCQTRKDFCCLIVHDGPARIDLRKHFEYLTAGDERFEFIEMEEKRPEGEFGSYWRRWILFNKVETRYCTFSNLDNLYTCAFVAEMLEKALAEDLDICMTNVLHNYAGGITRSESWQVLESEPKLNSCDYVSYIIRTSLARKTGFNHIGYSGQDGMLCEEACQWHAARVGKTGDKVLSVHQ
ncbi:MAG: hypothetical protein K2W95_01940 [Candidatus Obscuribacterales bacterium]|nr:hypothetical protein [Candidatus Obscuribacterales bacterium]